MTKLGRDCARCGKPFSYFYETGRKPKYCAAGCREEVAAEQRKGQRRRDGEKLKAIRSGTLNPRSSLQTCNSVASCSAVLVPPSPVPANDFAWVVEPPLPKQSWVFEVDGRLYHRLEQAEAVAREYQPGVVSIYCRPAAEKVAVNQ